MIINEDCYNYLPTIKSNSIDLVLTDEMICQIFNFLLGLKIDPKMIYQIVFG